MKCLRKQIEETMILSATFSKPTSKCQELLGKPFIKIRIWKNASSLLKSEATYDAEFFTKTQSFHQHFSEDQMIDFLQQNIGTSFKSLVKQTQDEEITILANRHGELKEIHHPKKNTISINKGSDKKKNYILMEGSPIPFLVKLGVMTEQGKVVAQKYDKFRQINRFLEFISDILEDVKKIESKEKNISMDEVFSKEAPLQIVDFGCGKSYLTFALYYYLTEIEKLNVEITGLDLKADVIKKCSDFAAELNYTGLNFFVGDVAKFTYSKKSDIVVTLHACDTATDYALDFAIKNNTKAILSVPCCQHELNLQMEKNGNLDNENPFASMSRFGIIRERMAALATDAIRGELLEQQGYSVQIMEFIDMEHTPKNLLIRAVKKNLENVSEKNLEQSKIRTKVLLENLGVQQKLKSILD